MSSPSRPFCAAIRSECHTR